MVVGIRGAGSQEQEKVVVVREEKRA